MSARAVVRAIRRGGLAPLIALAVLSGCFPARYLGQAARGQLAMLHAAEPIHDVVTRREVSPRIARLLLAVGEVKRYGERQGLRPTGNYDRYADLRRPAAVWVVQACAPLSFSVRHWRMPVVGTIPYLGFFDERAARRYAESVASREGLDVYVRAAEAYSTLGWFDDPVLSTMIDEGDAALGDLANVVLHESVHATVYVNGQSAFNESLASFVADRLTPGFLAGALGRDAPETAAWLAAGRRREARVERLRRAYRDLDAVYRSEADDATKLAEKSRILAALQAELRLTRPLNNAALAGFQTYASGTEAFERLFDACGGSHPRLLGAVRTLTDGDFGEPQRREFDDVLDRLAERGCPQPPPRAKTEG